jgi:hypothetical protein
MTASKATKARWAKQWSDPKFEESILTCVQAARDDPFGHSQLRYWLSLEVWEREEGLLVLAGVEPGTVVVSDEEPSFMGSAEWTNVMPFSQPATFYQFPEPEGLDQRAFGDDELAFESYLKACEERRQILSRHQALFQALQHRLDHTPSALGDPVCRDKWRPASFIGWAQSINFKPDWIDWAQQHEVITSDYGLASAPYFDADAADYPLLLHIAVRAWEYARSREQGTPKQRVLEFLSKNYSELPKAAREAIAQVANWQRAGGRPPRFRRG